MKSLGRKRTPRDDSIDDSMLIIVGAGVAAVVYVALYLFIEVVIAYNIEDPVQDPGWVSSVLLILSLGVSFWFVEAVTKSCKEDKE